LGHGNTRNKSHVLPHSHWDVHKVKCNKSYCRGRVQSEERAEIRGVLRAVVILAKTCVLTHNRIHYYRPRQIPITTPSWVINDVLGYEVLGWKTPEWRKRDWPDGHGGATIPPEYRRWGHINDWIRKIEGMGIFVQFWLMAERDDEENGKAKEMADEAVRTQETYVEKLERLLFSLCEYAAKQLGCINIPRRSRKRKARYWRMPDQDSQALGVRAHSS
jgi:hypothetical protein